MNVGIKLSKITVQTQFHKPEEVRKIEDDVLTKRHLDFPDKIFCVHFSLHQCVQQTPTFSVHFHNTVKNFRTLFRLQRNQQTQNFTALFPLHRTWDILSYLPHNVCPPYTSPAVLTTSSFIWIGPTAYLLPHLSLSCCLSILPRSDFSNTSPELRHLVTTHEISGPSKSPTKIMFGTIKFKILHCHLYSVLALSTSL
jgi:hypothetical protein